MSEKICYCRTSKVPGNLPQAPDVYVGKALCGNCDGAIYFPLKETKLTGDESENFLRLSQDRQPAPSFEKAVVSLLIEIRDILRGDIHPEVKKGKK